MANEYVGNFWCAMWVTAQAPFPPGEVHRQARFFRWTTGPAPAAPAAGGEVDGVAVFSGSSGAVNWPLYNTRLPGLLVQVEAGGTFGTLTDLATDGSGRAVPAGAGDVVVARSMESAGAAGDIVLVAFGP